MPTWTVTESDIDLWIIDEPLAYEPATGPRISAQIYYDQHAPVAYNPSVFSVGLNWGLSLRSFVAPSSFEAGFQTTFYPAGGGTRTYTPQTDGSLLDEAYSATERLVSYTNSDGTLSSFKLFYQSGAVDVYGFGTKNYVEGKTNFFLSQKIDPFGRTTSFIYQQPTSYQVILKYVVDADGQTNTLDYTNATDFQSGAALLVSKITDPFGRSARLSYDVDGNLTNVIDVAGISSSFGYGNVLSEDNNENYNANYWLTNLVTPYGSTSFYFEDREADDSLVMARAIIITEPDGNREMYCYPDPGDDTGVPAQYTDPAYVPTSPPAGFFLSTTINPMYDFNSFYWNREQFASLSHSFLTTGPTWDFSKLLESDFLLARLRIWDVAPGGIPNGSSLGMERDPSPDGTTLGAMTWYGYPGQSGAGLVGTNPYPSLIMKVMPDGSEWYTEYVMNNQYCATQAISTYSSGTNVLTRTNRYVYSSDGTQLLLAIDPDGVTNAAFAYNTQGAITNITDGMGYVTAFTYNPYMQVSSVTRPSGLVTTNIFNTTNWLATTYDYAIAGGSPVYYRTNTYTYANGLVNTHTDERGLTVTQTWDNLQRLTNISYPDGTSMAYTYSNLDLVQIKDRMGLYTKYGYNSIRQLTAITNANTNITYYGYCLCGAPTFVTNALGLVTQFGYDNQGNRTAVIYPDGYVVINQFNLNHQLIISTDGAGVSSTNWYNNQGLLTAVSNYAGLVLSNVYDINDRAVTNIDANGVSVVTTYDFIRRRLSRSYPDGGAEHFAYSTNGLAFYTNQLNLVTSFGYDAAGRKIAETNANGETNGFTYSPTGDLLALTDGKGQTTSWAYDAYGRMTNKSDAAGNVIFVYAYDENSRVTNRWTPVNTNTTYAYDSVGNLTNVLYLNPHSVTTSSNSYAYDALGRLTNMIDAVGAVAYKYDAAGQMLNESGPWLEDAVTYTYNNRLRASVSLQQPTSDAWVQTYHYDPARRLTGTVSPAGTFAYYYDGTRKTRVAELLLPGGAYVTNSYDTVARQLSTALLNSSGTNFDSYAYVYNVGNQRTNVTRADGSYVNYTYDKIGQLTVASGAEAGHTARLNETLKYAYDAAHNLSIRTNNALIESFNVNVLNELSSVTNTGTLTVAGTTGAKAASVTISGTAANLYNDNTFALGGFTVTNGNNSFTAIAADSLGRSGTNTVNVYTPSPVSYTYDLNGNLVSDGTRYFVYDGENQLVVVYTTNAWKSEFVYDGELRRRIRREYSWKGGGWQQTNEVHYIYDVNLVVQERDANNLPDITYTRGSDLSGALQNAGGIGGLLAMSQFAAVDPVSYYYHTDENGNVTALINTQQVIVARYLYDPFGVMLAMSGPAAGANRYRFSSKEWHASSGLLYYLYRYYDANLQRWLNRDPLEESGFELIRHGLYSPHGDPANLYLFVKNAPANTVEYLGLGVWNACKALWFGLWHTVPGSEFPDALEGFSSCNALGLALQKAKNNLSDCIIAHLQPGTKGNCNAEDKIVAKLQALYDKNHCGSAKE